ncbi:MAG: hypothetical protein BWZ10_02499 [candidate division BRC1 bacterium ADurb.BinA364]|nr:MAG: hypothetical protein BWZ10_02499 [candidate division BRC1 bacterium ADurb.BinA364]
MLRMELLGRRAGPGQKSRAAQPHPDRLGLGGATAADQAGAQCATLRRSGPSAPVDRLPRFFGDQSQRLEGHRARRADSGRSAELHGPAEHPFRLGIARARFRLRRQCRGGRRGDARRAGFLDRGCQGRCDRRLRRHQRHSGAQRRRVQYRSRRRPLRTRSQRRRPGRPDCRGRAPDRPDGAGDPPKRLLPPDAGGISYRQGQGPRGDRGQRRLFHRRRHDGPGRWRRRTRRRRVGLRQHGRGQNHLSAQHLCQRRRRIGPKRNIARGSRRGRMDAHRRIRLQRPDRSPGQAALFGAGPLFPHLQPDRRRARARTATGLFDREKLPASARRSGQPPFVESLAIL